MKEPQTARESSVRPLNATSSAGGQRAARVTKKMMSSVMESLNDSQEKYTEDLSYNKGVATAYTMEKGYGDRRPYNKEYTKAPTKEEKGWRWSSDDVYAAAVFKQFERKGIKLKKLVHHGSYD